MQSIAPSPNIIRTLHRSTSIDELLEKRLISQRTYKGCKNNGYTTVGSLLNLKDLEILRWSNCGRKVLTELRTLINSINDYVNVVAESTDSTSSGEGEFPKIFAQLQNNIFCYSVLQEVLNELKIGLNNTAGVSIKKLQALEAIVSGLDETSDTAHPNTISKIMDVVNIPVISR